MKKILALQLLVCNIVAMEILTANRFEISWKEMVQIGQRLYADYGEKVDLHELILCECKPDDIVQQVPIISTLISQPSKPKIERRNTHDKIYDGFKSACATLISIRKTSSSPTP